MGSKIIASLALMGAATLVATAPVGADELTLYFYPAPRRLDWNSPRGLAWSVVENALLPSSFPLKHEIGHASVRLSCGGSEILTGMTNLDDGEERRELLGQGDGLGILFHRFAGRLQAPDEIQTDLDARFRKGKVAWLSYRLNPGTCARLTEYFEEFRERGYSRFYGLSLRPRLGEGAGCSAFAVSFLDLAGLLDDEFTHSWSRTLEAPLPLIGGEENRHVSLWAMLFGGEAGHWGTAGRGSREIAFWDPEEAYYWVLANWKRLSTDPSASRASLERDGSARGLSFDASDVPTPRDPIWLPGAGSADPSQSH